MDTVSTMVREWYASQHGTNKCWYPKQEIKGKYRLTTVYNPITYEEKIIEKHRLPCWIERRLGFDDAIRSHLAMECARSWCRCEYSMG